MQCKDSDMQCCFPEAGVQKAGQTRLAWLPWARFAQALQRRTRRRSMPGLLSTGNLMKRVAPPSVPAGPSPAATIPAPGEPKPGTRSGSDPEAKNDVPRAVHGDGAAPHRPAAPSEIDRSTDA